MDVEAKLQREILRILKADAAITTLVGARIYDTAPSDATLPCVSIASISSVEFGADNVAGTETTVAVACDARGQGARVQARTVGTAIYAALNRKAASMTLTGHDLALFRFVSSAQFRSSEDPAEFETRAVVTFRALTTEQAEATGN